MRPQASAEVFYSLFVKRSSRFKSLLNLRKAYISRGLRPGLKVCSEHINDWQYLSLGDLEQDDFFPKVNLKVFLCLNA